MVASKQNLLNSISEEILKNLLDYVEVEVGISNLLITS